MITVNLQKGDVVYIHRFRTEGFAKAFRQLAVAHGYHIVQIKEISDVDA